MCPKRKQNMRLAIHTDNKTADELGIIHDYLMFQGVLRHTEKFDIWGDARLYPCGLNFKGVNSWTMNR
jgi:hypothetical protein